MATLKELEATVQDLKKRLQPLEDLAAIQKLKARYAQLADARQFAQGQEELNTIANELANMFTEDGTWDGGEEYTICRGRKQVFEHFAVRVHKLSVHYFMVPHLTIEGNKAHGRWYMFCPITTPADQARWLASFEDDEYLKVNGQWFQKSMRLTSIFRTPFDEGWAKVKWTV